MRYFISLCLFALALAVPLTVVGQSANQVSSAEDVAIALYKAGNIRPNFERWIKHRPPYKLTSPARRPAVMEREKIRLKVAYDNFNLSDDFIIIKTPVNLKPTETIDDQGKALYFINPVLDQALDTLYFPYSFLEESIAVIPDKLDSLMSFEVSKSQYDRASVEVKKSKNSHLIIQLRANKSDLSKPYKIDGIDQWLLFSDVMSIEIWSIDGQRLLWEYVSPWYVSSQQSKRNPAYDERSLEIMRDKKLDFIQ